MADTTTIYGFPYPEIDDLIPADGPAAYQALAQAAESVLATANIQTYTPSWTATGSVQPSGASVRTGWYSIDRGVCNLFVYIGFGPSTVGGRGDLRVSLPVNQRADVTEQSIMATTHIPGVATYTGVAPMTNNVLGWLRPQFVIVPAESPISFWRNADSSGAVQTGIPAHQGGLTVVNGGNFVAAGSYLI